MRQKSGPEKQPAEDAIRDISGARPADTFQLKRRSGVVLEGLRGERRQHRRTLSARGHRLVDVLWLVERVPGGRQEATRAATFYGARRGASDEGEGISAAKRKR